MDDATDDILDRSILAHLRQDGRMSFKALGDAVGLSANAAADRVRALQRRGVIEGFTVVLGDGPASRRIEAVVDLRLRDDSERARFEERVHAIDAIVGAVHLTGPYDYQLRLSCSDPAQIEATVAELKASGGVRDTQTRVVMRRVV